MRAFLLIALLALAFSALAQRSSTTGTQVVVQPPATPYTCNEPQSRFQHQADSLLQNLDKSQIPTGILYDRVAGMASLDIFNLSYNNADTSGINHFLQAYYEMHVGSYANTSNEPCRQVLRDNARYYQERGQVLIGALRYRFNYIDTNAVRNNQLRWSAGVNSQLLDMAGRNSSPYLLREVVVGAALIDTLRSSSSNFRLDPGSTFTNTGVALTSASIDFGNGSGAQTCTPGQIVQVSYSMAGRKVLRYTFTYADGSQFTTYSSAYVTQAACTSCRGLATLGADPCLTVPLTATVAYRGAPGEVDVSYYYRTANQNCPGVSSVRRPVVVIDGFDHNDIRNGPMIFNDYLSYRSINNNRENLGTELRNADYDVVIMNPKNLYTTVRIFNRDYQVITRHGGSDYIERNGLALVSLIQELNRQMQSISSTEQIVIVGPSMGGQIARYALSYMEANAMPHNTRLFVSLDSPHNGANIPIGLQHFVKYFADQTKDAQLVDALEQLDAPASRELTLSYYQQYYSQGPTFAQHPDRTTFMNAMLNFRPGGYPANLRRIAVTNGALNGARQRDQNGQVINDQDQAFFLEQKGTPRQWDTRIDSACAISVFPKCFIGYPVDYNGLGARLVCPRQWADKPGSTNI